MAGVKGRSGPKQEKPFRDALLLAVKEATADEDKQKLRKLAEKLVEKAIEGDVTAIKEVADRLDGKAAQSMTLSGDEEAPLVSRIEIVAASVVSSDSSTS